MKDQEVCIVPEVLSAIQQDTATLGFAMASERNTGALLRSLAASKPGGRFLELGTGTGLGSTWLLAGMDRGSRLVSVDKDAKVMQVAKKHLGQDSRISFLLMDGADYLEQAAPEQFDFIYADAGPGKFRHLDLALSLLSIGGIYFVDDLLPQSSWPEGHAPKVPALIAELAGKRGFVSVQMNWASGLMMLVRTSTS